LVGAEEAIWAHVEQMIGTANPDVYDDAIRLLTDLQALAERDDRLLTSGFGIRVPGGVLGVVDL
jgi:hypothetical protein